MIDWSPLLISLKTASLTMIFVFFLGLLAARWVVNLKSEGLKMVLDGLLTLPLVLPPTVAGYFLLYIFGVKRPIGALFSVVFRGENSLFLRFHGAGGHGHRFSIDVSLRKRCPGAGG